MAGYRRAREDWKEWLRRRAAKGGTGLFEARRTSP
jgi:hypothetical protein